MSRFLIIEPIAKYMRYFMIGLLAIGSIFCLLLFSASHPLLAGEVGKILLINSNMSVEKYALAQSRFQPGSDISIVSLDLGNPWVDKDSVKKAIQKESPDLIYCIGSKAYMQVYQSSEDIPVIFSSVLKWQLLPLHARNFGIDVALSAGMQLMTYRYLFPNIKRLGVLYSGTYRKVWIKQAIKAARSLNINLIAQSVDHPSDLTSVMNDLLPKVDALWLIPDPGVLSSRAAVHAIFQQSNAKKIPVFAYSGLFIKFGAVLALSADTATIGNQASVLANEILAGKMPERKVQFPAGSQITLNIGLLAHYGVQIREGAMKSVDKVIR